MSLYARDIQDLIRMQGGFVDSARKYIFTIHVNRGTRLLDLDNIAGPPL